MTEYEQLEQAIAALEAQRRILGDAVVDAALNPMREKLAELKAQALPSQQQRKQVTILFADVSGFTAISETLDAEEVSDTMKALWRRIDAVIVEHGGRIDKHIGDAVMALWGVDKAREDDPERAIRAALDMQAQVADFRQGRDLQLAIEIGLNTGPVLLGEVSTGEFTAIGDTVNLAKRMEQAAPAGGILITYDTYCHVRGLFDVQPQEPLQVKGKTEPVRSYVVQQARPRAFRVTRGVEGIETRMVGREAELLILQNIWRDVIEDHETRVVSVVGEAGVGKSRLLYEFDAWVKMLPMYDERVGKPDQVTCLKGRTTPEMQKISYSVVRDLFAFQFGIRESDSAAVALEKFRAGMGQVLEPEKADIVGHFIGFDFSASPAVRNLLGSPSFGRLATAYFSNYIRSIASQPVMIILDDIHWADDSSLDLVEHIVKEIPRAPLLIVCLARLDLFERRPDWGQGHAAYTRLDLKPLSRRASRALVDELLQKVDIIPGSLHNLIVEGAEGNPYYVEELVKMLIDDGVIVRGGQQWRVELERLAQVRVPPTLTGVVQARLDSLPQKEKTILQRASVVGRLFWDAAVAELAADEVEAAQVDGLLDAVESRELIFRREHSAFAETDEYIFKHAILRDVTYETVLLKLRKVYHAQVARWLEAHAGERVDEFLSLIAGHFELAGEKAKAADYLLRSGEESFKVSAYRDAISAFKRALSLLPESAALSRAALLIELGKVYEQVDDHALSTQHFEDGLALARKVGDTLKEAVTFIGLGRIAMRRGEYDEAQRQLERGLELAKQCDDQKSRVHALRLMGSIAFRHGDAEQAARYAEESLAVSRRLGDRQEIAGALSALSNAARMQGAYEEAERWLEESLALYREIGERAGAVAMLNNLGELARIQGKYEKAARYYEKSLAMAEEIGSRMAVAAGLLNLGLVHASLGEDIASLKYLYEALDLSAAIGVIPIVLFTLAGIAGLWAKAGRYERAAELLGLALNHPAVDAQNEREAEPILAMLRRALPAGDLEAALERGKSLELDAVVAEILEKATDQ
ncbi:MAG: tetratricopeptide repeat protein [Anaerolineales bacterium]|nr:tetratricopeptide repeat protein [Anaerolineales bacterium]